MASPTQKKKELFMIKKDYAQQWEEQKKYTSELNNRLSELGIALTGCAFTLALLLSLTS